MFHTAPPVTIGGPLKDPVTCHALVKVFEAESTFSATSPLLHGTKMKGDMYAAAPKASLEHAGPANASPPALKVLPLKVLPSAFSLRRYPVDSFPWMKTSPRSGSSVGALEPMSASAQEAVISRIAQNAPATSRSISRR